MSLVLVRIPYIPGDSKLPGYEGSIECSSFRHAIDLPVSVHGPARTDGPSRHGTIELAHQIDAATPALRMAVASGENLGQVEISRLRTLAGALVPVERVRIMNAYAVRLELDTLFDWQTGMPSDVPQQTVLLSYDDITWEANAYVDGISAGSVRGSWSTALGETRVGF